jgi:hypothetical protein
MAITLQTGQGEGQILLHGYSSFRGSRRKRVRPHKLTETKLQLEWHIVIQFHPFQASGS